MSRRIRRFFYSIQVGELAEFGNCVGSFEGYSRLFGNCVGSFKASFTDSPVPHIMETKSHPLAIM